MSNERQINYVNDIQNRAQNLYYVDDVSEINSIDVKENDKIYAINDDKLFQMEVVDQEQTLSGDIVSFNGRNSTKIDSLTVPIEPVQDLHGYDNPWPAGGSINLINPNDISLQNIRNDNVYGFAFTEPGTYAMKSYYNGVTDAYLYAKVKKADSSYGSPYYIVAGNARQPAIITIEEGQTLYVYDAFSSHTIEKAKTLFINLLFQVAKSSTQPDQYYSYSNICPITGHTGMTVTRTGKNLFDKTKPLAAGLINASGDIVENVVYQHTDYYTKVKPLTAYIFSGNIIASSAYNAVAFYDKNKNFISRFVPSSAGVGANFTTPANCDYIRFNLSTNAYINLDIIQLEVGSTATAYEPYTGTTVPISWETEAGTVYGGTLDVTSGKLTSEYAKLTIDSANNITMNSVTNWYIAKTRIAPTPRASGQVGYDMWSDKFVTTGRTSGSGICFMHESGHIRFNTANSYSSAAEMLEALGGSIEFVYPLATPVEYQLTPQEVTTLLGTNNIWTDTGSITLKISEKGITAFELEPHI